MRIANAFALAGIALAFIGTHASANTAATYPSITSEASTTHVRCHYRADMNPASAATDFLFADGEDSTIVGHWQGISVLPGQAMFFTNVSYARLRATCIRTLAEKGIPGELVTVSAADNVDSYNYQIWSMTDSAPGKPVERIVAFGDSLSDSGNVFNASLWKLPGASWFAGRFSNGPVWVEHLAAKTGLPLVTWAVGGAESKDVYVGLINGIGSQVDSYVRYMKHTRDYDVSRTLFTLLIGGNDFVSDDTTAQQALDDQEKALETLANAGATKILIVNLPDLSKAPVFLLRRDDAQTVTDKVDHYNARIGKVTEALAARHGIEVRVVDARSHFDELVATPAKFGFSNVSDSCLDINTPGALNYITRHALREGCDPQRYIFWDTLHPTTRVHELMATWALTYTPPAWGLR
ncbi:thermolabile hemolysin [Luteibacter rhizovicinus]|uniref:Thermolabile hemolysin n=1 Tax=Luteibacter rhizovicinus TaxID=242606 RepID=A0A4R3YJE8_9GAMM|nr:SGNH/GDSL hydrolase family protein [Luteibacter rhizovicinus]TCV92340.1 thermolabile hemolysin [Luteibacter rhizovicinus]